MDRDFEDDVQVSCLSKSKSKEQLATSAGSKNKRKKSGQKKESEERKKKNNRRSASNMSDKTDGRFPYDLVVTTIHFTKQYIQFFYTSFF